ncbi:MAG: hypothetical protein AAF585_20120 [Verrucomicrobiota bacterium]
MKNWIEKKLGPGETVKDLGVVFEQSRGGGSEALTMRVCDKNGDLSVVLIQTESSELGGEGGIIEIPAEHIPAFKNSLATAEEYLAGRSSV